MKIGTAYTWTNCCQELALWCRATPGDPDLKRWFDVALAEAIHYLEDRDFVAPGVPPTTYLPGYGEQVPADQVIADRDVPPQIRIGIFEYVAASRSRKNRAAGDGYGLLSGSSAGVSETYTDSSARSVRQTAMDAAVPYWRDYKPPLNRGIGG